MDSSVEPPSSRAEEPLHVVCELTEGICRALLSILMSTVSADSLNASGEAGWGGQHGPVSEPLVVLADSEALLSWEWSLGWSP